jgi:hypothetical protein
VDKRGVCGRQNSHRLDLRHLYKHTHMHIILFIAYSSGGTPVKSISILSVSDE